MFCRHTLDVRADDLEKGSVTENVPMMNGQLRAGGYETEQLSNHGLWNAEDEQS
jgi:hypothetical protein